MRKILTVIACFFALPVAAADCVGQNLIDQLAAPRRAALEAAVADIPYRHGLFWQAQKDGMTMTLIGTYHFGDPRHDLTMRAFGPYIETAKALLVEAGPEEMQRLTARMQGDPALLTVTRGPTLPERLSPQQWDKVSQVLSDRGIPDAAARRLTPWYAAMLMGLSPCMLNAAQEGVEAVGLDQMLIARAEAAGIPMIALEPWDTLFQVFSDLTPQEEIEMVLASLPAAQYADDYAQTLIDAYFEGDVWRIWEFGRIDGYDNSGLAASEVDAQMALGQERMIDARNKVWIAPLTLAARQAANEGGHIVAGFGALHMPGQGGVLNLLAQEGWTLTALDAPDYRQAPEADAMGAPADDG